MKIAQFEDSQGFSIGVERKGDWMNYSKAEALYYILRHGVAVEPLTTLQSFLESGEFSLGGMKHVVDFVMKGALLKHVRIAKNAVMKAPILRPPKIVALGLNYALHAKEGSFEVPKEPIVFVKAGSSVIGPNDTVRIPRGLGRMDHEVELAVVIGKRATRVRKRSANAYIAGYTSCNDLTARSVQT